MNRLTGRARIAADLDEQLPFVEADLRALRDTRIFLTGGTGFVGTWLLESIAHANARMALGIRVDVLARTPERFQAQHSELAGNAAFTFIRGDVRRLPPDLPAYDGIVHAATPASADLNRDAPFEMIDTIVEGGRAIVELAVDRGAIPLLFTSSGAIYGALPEDRLFVDEDYLGGPDPLSPNVAYHEGKRVGEFQCAVAHRRYGTAAKIARLFAFVGPYLPLDRHLAIGNFLANVHHGSPIEILGDGTTVRSYQYAAEMVTWLWAIYVRGVPMRAYNVGSEEALSMREIATLAAHVAEQPAQVHVHGVAVPGARIDRYVPSTQRIREELGVVSTIATRESMERTLAFLR